MILVLGVGWSYFLLELKSEPTAGVATAGVSMSSTVERVIQSARNIFQVPSPKVFVARAIGLAKVWLWATPGLVALAIWGYLKRESSAPLFLLAMSVLVTFVGYLFYPADQGHGWGFRYLHSTWFALPILAVASVAQRRADGRRASSVTAYFAACALASVLLMNGLRAHQVHEFIVNHKNQVPSAERGEPVVVLLMRMGYYQQDLVQNDPFLRSRPILAITRGTEADNAFIATHYPELELLERNYSGRVWGYLKD